MKPISSCSRAHRRRMKPAFKLLKLRLPPCTRLCKPAETVVSTAERRYRDALSYSMVCAGDMTAAMERLRDYETFNKQFCLRVVEYLYILFKVQVRMDATWIEGNVC